MQHSAAATQRIEMNAQCVSLRRLPPDYRTTHRTLAFLWLGGVRWHLRFQLSRPFWVEHMHGQGHCPRLSCAKPATVDS